MVNAFSTHEKRVKKAKRRGSSFSSTKHKARDERKKQQMAAPVTMEISSDTEMAEEDDVQDIQEMV